MPKQLRTTVIGVLLPPTGDSVPWVILTALKIGSKMWFAFVFTKKLVIKVCFKISRKGIKSLVFYKIPKKSSSLGVQKDGKNNSPTL